MRRISKDISTKEERAVNKITTILSDLTLDIEQMGYAASVNMPYIIFDRFVEVAESAGYNRNTDVEFSKKGNYYYDRTR